MKPLSPIFALQRLQPFILRREAAFRGDVDDQHDLAAVGGQVGRRAVGGGDGDGSECRSFQHSLVQPHDAVHLGREPLVVGGDQRGAALAADQRAGIRRAPCRRWPRRDCRSARRPAPAAAGWRARGRPRRAAARRPTAWTGDGRAARRGRARRAGPRPAPARRPASAPWTSCGRTTFSQRVEVGQQVMELVDEAERVAAQARCGRHRRASAASSPGDPDRALEAALEQADRLQQGRLARARRAEQRDDLARLRPSRSTPRSTSIVTSPCAKLRFRPRVWRTGSLIAQHLHRIGARRLPAPG